MGLFAGNRDTLPLVTLSRCRGALCLVGVVAVGPVVAVTPVAQAAAQAITEHRPAPPQQELPPLNERISAALGHKPEPKSDGSVNAAERRQGTARRSDHATEATARAQVHQPTTAQVDTAPGRRTEVVLVSGGTRGEAAKDHAKPGPVPTVTPAQQVTAKAKPAKAKPAKAHSGNGQPAKAKPAKAKPAKSNPDKGKPAKTAKPAKANPAKVKAAKSAHHPKRPIKGGRK